MGDSPASSEILLHEHTTRVAPTNEKMRDRMLKLLKAAKQIQDAELETRAYDLMAQVTSRIERDDARKKDLKDSVEFFNEAQTVRGFGNVRSGFEPEAFTFVHRL